MADEKVIIAHKDGDVTIIHFTKARLLDETNIKSIGEQIMKMIDEIYTAHPFYGSRRIADGITRKLKETINRKHIQHLMREMGLEALYPKPRLSENRVPHPVYPYLLKGLPIVRCNQVWGTDITYIRMAHGFLYCTAYLDWFSRYVVSWQLSPTMETALVTEAAQEALTQAAPEIVNSDQGSQYTSHEYLNLWLPRNVKVSMDGRGRAMDNIFTERLWRSLKYEEVFLKSYDTVAEARQGIGDWFSFYNDERPHQSLKYKTPAEIYFKNAESFVS